MDYQWGMPPSEEQDFQSWDPMHGDYADPKFNSYDRGYGRNLPFNRINPGARLGNNMPDMNRSPEVQLYITGIPPDLTEQGLLRLFSAAGKVISFKICASRKPGVQESYGFVSYGTVREADDAIRQFNGLKLTKGKYSLKVSIALTKEEREQRDRENLEKEMFLSSLPSASQGASSFQPRMSGGGDPGYNLRQGPKGVQHVCKPSAGMGRAQKMLAKLNSVGKSPGKVQAAPPASQAQPLRINIPREKERPVQKPCTTCGKLGTSKCQRCKAPYCCRKCQETDWDQHKFVCKKPDRIQQDIQDIESRFECEVGEEMKDIVSQYVGVPLRNIKEKDLIPESLPNGCSVKVKVTHVRTPSDFYIVRADRFEALEELNYTLGESYSATTNTGTNAYVPSVGEVCAAKVDRDWYRVLVKTIELDATSMVLSLDYGFEEQVKVIWLRKLHVQNIQLQMQAIRCSLKGIKPLNGENVWSQSAIDFAKLRLNSTEEFLAKNVGSSDGKMLVQLKKAGDNMDISHAFVYANLAEPLSSPQSSPSSHLSGSPSAMPRSLQGSPVTGKLPQFKESVGTKSPNTKKIKGQKKSPPKKATPPKMNKTTPQAVKEVESPLPAPSVVPLSETPVATNVHDVIKPVPPPMPTVAKYLYKEKEITITVQQGTPSLFYAHVKSEGSLLELPQLQVNINEHYDKLPPKTSFKPTKNAAYAAKFSLDGCWYRAQVLDYNTKEATVLYLDYGNYEKVPFTKLHTLESPFCSLPFQAVCCKMHGLQGADNEQALQIFNDLTVGKELFAKVKDVSDTQTSLELFLPGEKKSLNKIMVAEGFAKSVPESSPDHPVEQIPAKQIHLSKDLKQVDVPIGEKFLVQVTDASSFDAFTVWNLKQENIETLKNLQIEVAQSCQENRKSYKPEKIGELVCAKFTGDQQWYRAQVLEFTNTGAVHVVFIDYGNEDNVGVDSIVEITPGLLEYPRQGITCSLTGVAGLVPGAQWNPQYLQPFEANFDMEVMNFHNDKYEVKLFDQKDNSYVNGQLIEAGVLADVKQKEKNIMVADMKYVEVAKSDVHIQVTNANTPEDITVMPVTEEVTGILKEITELMGQICQDQSNGYTPKLEGELVCAKYSLDGVWYRAKVLELAKTSALVKFVDYGNTETVSYNDMCKPSQELAEYAIVGLKVNLAFCGALGSGKEWDPNILQPLSALYLMTIDHVEQNTPAVVLTEVTSGIDLNAALVDEGILLPTQVGSQLAAPERKPHTPSKVYTIKDLPELSIPQKEFIEVQVLHAPNFDEIYVIITEGETKLHLDGIEKCRDKVPDQMDVTFIPHKGELVMAKYSADQTLERAQVLDVTDTSVTVHFLDLGNKETVSMESVCRIHQDFVQYPALAVLCSFADIKELVPGREWDPLLLQPLTVKYDMHIFDQEGKKLRIDLFKSRNGHKESVSRSLIEMGMAISVQGLESASRQEPILISDIAKKFIPSSPNTVVKVYHINSLTDFYIQVLDDSEEKLQSVMIELNQTCSNLPRQPRQYKPSEMVAALFANVWYRASVLQLVSPDKYKVFYVDYGNEEEVSAENMLPLTTNFIGLPQAAIHCALDISEPIPDQFTTEWFKSIALEQDFRVKCTSQQGDLWILDLLVKTTGDSVCSEIRSACEKVTEVVNQVESDGEGLSSGSELQVLKSVDRPTTSPGGMGRADTPSAYHNEIMEKISSSFPPLQVEGDTTGVLTHVLDPSHFYIQPAAFDTPTQGIDVLRLLLEAVALHCEKTPQQENLPKVGDLCLAKYIDDWNRAVVVESKPGGCKVLYIDYGNTEDVTTENLRPYVEPFSSVAIHAMKCALADVAPDSHSGWSQSAIDTFKEHTADKSITFTIVEKREDMSFVKILFQHESQVVDVSEWLIEQNLAQRYHPKPQPDGAPAEINPNSPRDKDKQESGGSDVDTLREENLALKRELEELRKLKANMNP